LQERQLGEEERRDLQKQATGLEKDLQSGRADADTLKRAAATYTALGEGSKAASMLERLTEAQPSNPEAWQLLVSCCNALSVLSFQTLCISTGPSAGAV
jgi:predicted Zn-dependent protease